MAGWVQGCKDSQDCVKDLMVTGDLVDADPNATWWQRIPVFAASYLLHTPECRSATGETVHCYDETGDTPSPQALLPWDTAYGFTVPTLDDTDDDAVVVLTHSGEDNIRLSFSEIEEHQPIKVSLQGKRLVTLNHVGVAVRTWGETDTGTEFRRCVEVGVDGAKTRLRQRTNAWSTEHFATVSTDPCGDSDRSFAGVNFVYEDGERHFVNPCYKTMAGTWKCTITPKLVSEMANEHYTDRGKRIAIISEVTKTAAEVGLSIVTWEFGIGFFGLSSVFDSAISQAAMASFAIKGVAGGIHRLSVCQHELGGDCFDEKLDLSVHLAINAAAVAAFPGQASREAGIEARTRLWSMLRGIWEKDDAERAVTGLLSSYPWVGDVSGDSLEAFSSALQKNPGGLNEDVLDRMEDVDSDDDLVEIVKTLDDSSSDWEDPELGTLDEHEPVEDHEDEGNNAEICSRSNVVHRGLAGGEAELPEIPNMYSGDRTFAHDRSGDLVASTSDSSLNDEISALIDAEHSKPSTSKMEFFEQWEVDLKDYGELAARLKSEYASVVASSFYPGTFGDYDLAKDVIIQHAFLRSNYSEALRQPFHVDGIYAGLMTYVQRDDSISSPYATLVPNDQANAGILGKPAAEVTTEWKELDAGVVNTFFSGDFSQRTGLQAAIHTAPDITSENAGRRFIAFYLMLPQDVLDRLMVARISQRLMDEPAAIRVAERLFSLNGEGALADPRDVDHFDELAELVDETKIFRHNDIYRLVDEEFRAPGQHSDSRVLDSLRDFLVESGAKDDCFGGRMLYPDCDGDRAYSDHGIVVMDEDHANSIFDCKDGEDPDGGWSDTRGEDTDDHPWCLGCSADVIMFCDEFDGQSVSLLTNGDRYVSTPDGDYAELDHEATSVSSVNMLTAQCDRSTTSGKVAFRTYHGRYIRAASDPLVVNQSEEGEAAREWEYFTPWRLNGSWAFESHHGRYLHAASDGSMIQDDAVEDAGTFVVQPVQDFCELYEDKPLRLISAHGTHLTRGVYDDDTDFINVPSTPPPGSFPDPSVGNDHFVPVCDDGLAFEVHDDSGRVGFMSTEELSGTTGRVVLTDTRQANSRFTARQAPGGTWVFRTSHGQHSLLRAHPSSSVDHHRAHGYDRKFTIVELN